MGDLSPHFSTDEMACKHCKRLQLDPRLLPALERLRDLAGGPIVIHDAYRCPQHNAAVGGVNHSQHELGAAADLDIPGKSLQAMYDLAKQVPAFADGGIGAYSGLDGTTPRLHVDVRRGAARWGVERGETQVPLSQVVTP